LSTQDTGRKQTK